jgi:putative ABC transport system ATP-binding protein
MFRLEQVKFKEIIDISRMDIGAGVITGVIGASGSGKTTFLKLLNKMISPTDGKIYYHNQDLAKIDSVSHRREVMMLSQTPIMFEGSIRENLGAAHAIQGRALPDEKELAKVLTQLALKKDLDEDTEKLSGGEKQRIALGRIILANPKVLLLDEPSSALDMDTEDFIIDMIVNYARETGKTLIMVTHSQDIAKKYTDEIISM